jgi:hypothetical protein
MLKNKTAKNRNRYYVTSLCKSLVHESLQGLNSTDFRLVLDGSSVGLDDIDGGERLSVQVRLDEFTFFVSAEAVDINIKLSSELLVFVFHALGELAPGSVDNHDGWLARLGDLNGSIGRFNLLDLGLVSLPQVTFPGLFGTVNVDTTFGLGGTVGVGQTNETSLTLRGVLEPCGLVTFKLVVNEANRCVFWDRDGVLGITMGWVSLGVEWVVGHLVLGNVVEGIFQSPVGDGVALGEASTDGGVLELVDPSTLKSLPPCSSVDHAVGIASLESTLEGFHLAHTIVLLNILLPQVSSVSLVVGGLVANGDSLGAEDLGLEAVVLLDLAKERNGLGEEVEGVDDHDLALAVLEVAHAVQKVGDDDITGNHGIGEDGVFVILAGDLEGEHSLLLQVLHAHFFGFRNELFLVELLVGHFQAGGLGEGHAARGKGRAESSAIGGGEGENKLHGGFV